MEAFSILSQMDNISEELANDPRTQQQLKDFWNMLDEMSENNPEEYKAFIEKNLKQGVEEFKSSSSKSAIYSKVGYSVKTYTPKKKEVVIINVVHNTK